jgi:hypothetical protein
MADSTSSCRKITIIRRIYFSDQILMRGRSGILILFKE